MLLEGIKNLFLLLDVVSSTDVLNPAFKEFWNFTDTYNAYQRNSKLETLLRPLGISLDQALNDLDAAADKNPDKSDTAWQAQYYRWIAEIVDKIFLLYNEKPDERAEQVYKNYIGSNDTIVINDMEYDNGKLANQFSDLYLKNMVFSGQWLVAVGGALLVCMAILNIMQRRPKNRFAWTYSLGRVVMGSILIVIGIATRNIAYDEEWVKWMIPTVTISYFIATLIDWTVLHFSIRSIRKKEGGSESQTASGNEKGSYDTGRGWKLSHLSELSYDKTSL